MRLLLCFFVFFVEDGGGGYGVIAVEAEQADALRGTAGFADFVGVDADDLAVFGDDHYVRLFGDLKRGDDGAVAVGGLHVDDALAAARGDAVFGEGGALAIALFGDGEHERRERVLDVLVFEFFKVLRGFLAFLGDDLEVGLDGVHADDVVLLVEVHAVHAAGVAAHRANFGLAEKDGLAFVAGEEDHLLAVGKLCADQLVIRFEIDSYDSGGTRIGEFGESRFLYRAVLRGQEDEAAFFLEIGCGDEGGEFFVLLEFHEARDGFAACCSGGFGEFVDLQPVNAALGGEEQDVAMRRGNKEMLDEVLFLGLGADAALAAARLVAVDVGGRALDVARVADGDELVGIGDEIFKLDFVDLVHDLRAAVVAVSLVDFAQFAGDDLLELFVARQDFAQLGDQVANGLQFLNNFVDGELREAVQLQFEDRIDLCVAESERIAAAGSFDFGRANEAILAAIELHAFEFLGLAVFGDGDVLFAEILEQVFLGFGAAAAATDDANDVVEVVEGDLVADQDVFALFGFAKLEDGAAANHFHAVFDEELD